ncbi:glycoside hydrolase family 5 protein [Piedraia hortae CBS 480.64]|uniref:glucan 1,3-beta-glucosidase n=1 Tax=Piedraia hortae CBS 480.64 TaxID=1314780 RepID=A0A6A7C5E7_9PEZI|nr:glycoside hydrolase family 5 protein [Piedraia hortae CBS 480.64]
MHFSWSVVFDINSEKIRGVNLGGWTVLEPWITPSIFEGTPDNVVDEYTFCQTLGKDEAKRRLEEHWSSFITEDDFRQISAAGLNLVRMSLGYWSISPLDGDPYVQGAYDYVGKALDWASNHNLKVMIDLHGAPDSQNGFDNSGKRGGIGWMQGDTMQQTLTALKKLRDDHASHPALVAVELINEPLGIDMGRLTDFYNQGWELFSGSHVAVTVSDAFQGPSVWNSWGNDKWAIMVDVHNYQVFTQGLLTLSLDQHVGAACGAGQAMLASNKWTITGEFSGALTDCAKWLNGRGVGARYDGTFNYNGASSSYVGNCAGKYQGTVEGLGDADKNNIKTFLSAQLSAYEKKNGWIFWTWKNEGAPEWHFQNLTAAGLTPNPLSAASGC